MPTCWVDDILSNQKEPEWRERTLGNHCTRNDHVRLRFILIRMERYVDFPSPSRHMKYSRNVGDLFLVRYVDRRPLDENVRRI